MSLTWKDGLATVLVGAAGVFYLLWVGGSSVTGLSGLRALALAIFGLGLAGCTTARSNMEAVYGVGGKARPPLLYVVVTSALGGVTLVAGMVAIFGGSSAALATLSGTMVALWVLATFRHWASHPTPEVIRAMR
jgi:hypothetical protein